MLSEERGNIFSSYFHYVCTKLQHEDGVTIITHPLHVLYKKRMVASESFINKITTDCRTAVCTVYYQLLE
jgi:hypothetical protein